MKMSKSFISLTLALCAVSMAALAANPVSQQYVDQKAAYLQSEINHLSASGSYPIGSLYPNAQNPDGVVIYNDGHGHGIAAAMTDAVNPSNTTGATYDKFWGKFQLWCRRRISGYFWRSFN
jgi:hypothetical protein